MNRIDWIIVRRLASWVQPLNDHPDENGSTSHPRAMSARSSRCFRQLFRTYASVFLVWRGVFIT